MFKKIAIFSIALALVATMSAPLTARADSPDDWEFAGQDYAGFGDWIVSPRTPIGRRDLDLYSERLALSEDQLTFVTDRYDALVTEYRKQWLDFAEQRTDSRYQSQISGDWEQVQRDLRESKINQKELVDSLVEDFMSDLRIVLTPDQDAQWTDMLRDRIRSETLTVYTCFNDERFDLVECVRMLDLPEDDYAKLDDTLERYSETMHPVLQNRNRKLEELAEAYQEMEEFNLDYSKMMRTGDVDENERMSMQDRQEKLQERIVAIALEARDACARVRDVNIRYRGEIQRLLPDTAIEDYDKATNPKPRTTMENWWNEYSRANQIITTLENLEATKTMMSSYAAGMGDNEEMQEFMMLMQAAEPLSTSQKRTLDDIKERHKQARDRVKERYDAKRRAKGEEIDESKTFTVATPAAALRFRHIDYEGDYNPSSKDDEEGNLQQEMGKELNKIEQDTINEVRAILSVRQRMAIANF